MNSCPHDRSLKSVFCLACRHYRGLAKEALRSKYNREPPPTEHEIAVGEMEDETDEDTDEEGEQAGGRALPRPLPPAPRPPPRPRGGVSPVAPNRAASLRRPGMIVTGRNGGGPLTKSARERRQLEFPEPEPEPEPESGLVPGSEEWKQQMWGAVGAGGGSPGRAGDVLAPRPQEP